MQNDWFGPYYCCAYTFKPDHPRRSDPAGLRWEWLVANVSVPGDLWDWSIPWTSEEDLVYYFALREDYACFVLTWG